MLEKNDYRISDLYIELLSECNLRCPHCYNSSGKSSKILSYNKIIDIIDEAINLKCSSIALSGGEPLMHPNIWEILDYIDNKNLSATLVTNATLIDEDSAMLLSKYNKLNIQISIDGSNSDIHNASRGNGSFENTLLGIYNLKKYNIIDKVKIYYCIKKDNYTDIYDLAKLVRNLGIPKIVYNYVIPTGRGKENKDNLYLTDSIKETLQLKLNEIQMEFDDISIKIPSILSSCHFISDDFNNKLPLKINYFGDVYLCSIFENSSNLSVGNIHISSLNTIIENNRITKLLSLMKNMFVFNSNCHNCLFEYNCGKGCPAMLLLQGDILENTDSMCNIRKMLMSYV